MNNNTEAITTVLNKLITIGSTYSSDKYIKFVLDKIIRDLVPQYAFAEKIRAHPEIYVAPGIDHEDPKKVGDFLNLIVAKLGVNIVNYSFKNALTPAEEIDLQKWGI